MPGRRPTSMPRSQAYFAKCRGEARLRAQRVARLRLRQRQAASAFILMADDLMLGDSGLSKLEREMIAVAVSAVNHCHYCLTSHGAAVRQRGQRSRARRADRRRTTAPPTCRRARRRCWTSPSSSPRHRQDRGSRPGGAAQGRVQRPRHLGHRRRRRFYNMSNRMAAAADMRPNRGVPLLVRERRESEVPSPRAAPAKRGSVATSAPRRGADGKRRI